MNKELDQVLVNEYYQQGYKNGYKKASNLNYNDQNKNNDIILLKTPYISINYYTHVVTLLIIFIIFVILSYNSHYKTDYISQYKDPCLLKISSTYSGTDCI
jgi:hypothetical protein